MPRGSLHLVQRTWVVSLALGALALSLPPEARAAEERLDLRGASASAPVAAHSLDQDLRDLPVVKDWEPGDPIKEVPRRRTRPASQDRETRGGLDPLLALSEGVHAVSPDFEFTTPILNIAGQGFSGVNPPDTVGDVGPSHYIQAINQSGGTRVTVYGKTGGVLAGPFTLASLGGTGACASGLGDPIVLYDSLAGRWLLSEFAATGNNLCVYVSKTGDPISGGWWFYQFTTPNFPDYPKYGVWPDAYYVGTNENSPAVYALDRARMLSGQPATSQRFTAAALSGFSFQMLTPADLDGPTAPPAGAPGLFLRHRDSEAHGSAGAADTLQIFEFRVNWTTPANSTFTGPTSVTVTEFDSALCGLTSFNCFPQPGSTTTLDPLREVTMFRVQYRNRGAFESLVSNLVTDVNGADRGGVRWFELRKSGAGAWGLHMEGTHSPDATHRWMGSAAVDKDGNLAVGYSVSASSTVFPGLRFAGRLAGDPAGTLAQGETTLIAGSAANGSNRWGDYAALSVDPADDCTFWFTSMYSPSSSWATRIGSFKFAACGGAPTPDFTVSAAPAALSIVRGNSGSSTITVSSTNGFSSAVALSCTGLPAGVTCSFSPASVTPPANGSVTSTLTVSVGAAAATGSFSFNVAGTAGALTRTAAIGLTVTAPATPDFSVSAAPSALSANAGGSASSTVTVSSLNAFSSAVALSCTGLPAGVACGLAPASVTPPANGSVTSALTVSVGAGVAAGSYSFSVTGSSGALTRSQAMSLSVTVPGGNQVLAFSAAPGLAIPDNNTTGVTSTINVAAAQTITSVSVSVGITHTFQGDLEVALIAPDNTTVLLHNRTGSGTDNINTTYNITTRSAQALTVLNGKSTAGAWRLRVRDLASVDTGTLNTWRLTFNGYATASPGLAIPDNNTTGVTSTINLAASGTVTSVRVRVGITHTFQGDLEVALIGPDNTTVLLHNRTGSGTDNINTVYPDLTVPAQALSAFNGKQINGAWRLRVRDLASVDTGTLNTWEIDFN